MAFFCITNVQFLVFSATNKSVRTALQRPSQNYPVGVGVLRQPLQSRPVYITSRSDGSGDPSAQDQFGCGFGRAVILKGEPEE